jgi:DNA-binding NarL/FixJ family response regulator
MVHGIARIGAYAGAVLTSSREEQDVVTSYDSGVNAWIVKPVDFRDFVSAVKLLGGFWAVVNEPPPTR